MDVIVGAWWLGRAASSLLFGVGAGDLVTFAVVSLVLTFVAWRPAWFQRNAPCEGIRSGRSVCPEAPRFA
jgi:hypothetical protein